MATLPNEPTPDLPGLTRRVVTFRDARDWKRFHNPKDLALSLVLEAAELLEIFQWQSTEDSVRERCEERRNEIEDELADVLIYTLLIADGLGIDLSAALSAKLEKNEVKYPIEKAKGSSRKYTEL